MRARSFAARSTTTAINSKEQHMFSNWKIGKRLTLAFAITLMLVGVVAAAGFWGLSQIVTTVGTILNRDTKLMEYASDLEARTLNLRRFEKDVFLNVADAEKVAEYSAKWQAAHAAAVQDLDQLQQLSTEDAASIAEMRKDLTTYAAGFAEVLRGIGVQKVRTPADANEAIAPYKDDIRRLDSVSSELAVKNVQRM